MRVLFVCLGNFCRSPTAHAIAKHLYPEWKIDSAGTSECHNGEEMDDRAKETLKKHNMYYKVISQHITEFNKSDYDLILCMDSSNKATLLKYGIESNYVTFLTDNSEVPDPYCNNRFEAVFEQIFEAVSALKNYKSN